LSSSVKVIFVMDSSILSHIGGRIPVIWLATVLFRGLWPEIPIVLAVVGESERASYHRRIIWLSSTSWAALRRDIRVARYSLLGIGRYE
jgi:hypothetical protein